MIDRTTVCERAGSLGTLILAARVAGFALFANVAPDRDRLIASAPPPAFAMMPDPPAAVAVTLALPAQAARPSAQKDLSSRIRPDRAPDPA